MTIVSARSSVFTGCLAGLLGLLVPACSGPQLAAPAATPAPVVPSAPAVEKAPPASSLVTPLATKVRAIK